MNYYRTMQNPADGRWLVVHDVPGLAAAAIDTSCLTQGAALLEASFLERERRARLALEADDSALLGQRRQAA